MRVRMEGLIQWTAATHALEPSGFLYCATLRMTLILTDMINDLLGTVHTIGVDVKCGQDWQAKPLAPPLAG